MHRLPFPLPLLLVSCVLEKILLREEKWYCVIFNLVFIPAKSFVRPIAFIIYISASKEVMLSDMTLMDFQRISAAKSVEQPL